MIGLRPLVIATTLSFVVGSCARNPVTGKRELSFIGEQQEIAMGLEAAKGAAAEMGVYPDSGLQRYVNGLGQMLAKSSERPGLPWSFTVIDDPVVNAFALPGGPIFITRGILAHMNSEGQLVSVLGHEIGHVTARHSVSQISRAQLTQGLFIGAMILRPELQQFGDLGSQALGLAFLKFGRDDERQSDDLGFTYMTKAGYDPVEMAEMFRILDRTGGGADRVPEWMSTHPNPGNRVERTLERIAAWQRPAGPLIVNRDVFLRQIDGLVFGEDPRQGYFQQSTFLHPVLRFRFDFPAGWQTQNSPQQVAAISPNRDALLVLSGAGAMAPAQALAQFLGQQGIQSGGASSTTLNGLPAASAPFTATTQQGSLAGYVAFVQLDGTTYRLLAYTAREQVNAYDRAFRQSIGSFQRLTDPQALNVRPQRLQIVQLRSPMTLTQFQQQSPSTIPLAQLALINGLTSATTTLPAGTWIKRVVIP